MHVLIFTSFLITATAFGTTLVNRNYVLKLGHRNKLSVLCKDDNDYSTKKFKYNILPYNSIQNEVPFSRNLWYLISRGPLCNPVGLLKLHMLIYPEKKANVRRNSTKTYLSEKQNEKFSKKTKVLPPLEDNEIDFVRYHSLDKIYKYLNSLYSKYPYLVNIETIGKSFENRDIKLIKVSTGDVGTKATMLIVGGMNSNEWISPATVLYCIQQLVENPVNNYMLGKADWLFVPLTNPDGYEYSYKKNQSWKKTRSRGSNSRQCVGVDLNKNYDYRCNFTSSNDSCNDFYAGTKPFSEQEAKALLDYIKNSSQIQLFVNINNYGQSLEFPLGQMKKFIEDSNDLKYLADQASYAMRKYGGRKYEVKEFDTCGSEQWARREGTIKYTYNLKLPIENKENSKSQVPESDILPIAQEVFVAFREFQRILVSIYGVTYDLISDD